MSIVPPALPWSDNETLAKITAISRVKDGGITYLIQCQDKNGIALRSDSARAAEALAKLLDGMDIKASTIAHDPRIDGAQLWLNNPQDSDKAQALFHHILESNKNKQQDVNPRP